MVLFSRFLTAEADPVTGTAAAAIWQQGHGSKTW